MGATMTERLGDKLDRELKCGDPAFDWGMDFWFSARKANGGVGFPRSLQGMTPERTRQYGVPCGKPLDGAQWISFTEMGLRHAQCPHCGAVMLFALESDPVPMKAEGDFPRGTFVYQFQEGF